MTSSAVLKEVDADEGAKTNKDVVDAFAEQNVVAENVRNNARNMNVVATRTATDNEEFRGATKTKAKVCSV